MASKNLPPLYEILNTPLRRILSVNLGLPKLLTLSTQERLVATTRSMPLSSGSTIDGRIISPCGPLQSADFPLRPGTLIVEPRIRRPPSACDSRNRHHTVEDSGDLGVVEPSQTIDIKQILRVMQYRICAM